MSLNSSNGSQIVPPSSALSVYDFIFNCFQSTVAILNLTFYTVINILLLPIYVHIIYLGLQRWKQRHSSKAMTHSDLITYQVVIIEVANIMGCILCCVGIYADVWELIAVGVFCFPFKLTGHLLFHILTCMEKYLAVVHPVTYLGSRTADMIRIRNIIFGCIWVLCAIAVSSMNIVDELALIVLACCTICTSVLFISFFSISVLCALIQSKPGGRVGERQQVHQTKLRAFYTIITILGLLLLSSGSKFLTMFKSNSMHVDENTKCGLWLSVFWFCLPSSLVLPLMFLQRSGKLLCFSKNRNSVRD